MILAGFEPLGDLASHVTEYVLGVIIVGAMAYAWNQWRKSKAQRQEEIDLRLKNDRSREDKLDQLLVAFEGKEGNPLTGEEPVLGFVQRLGRHESLLASGFLRVDKHLTDLDTTARGLGEDAKKRDLVMSTLMRELSSEGSTAEGQDTLAAKLEKLIADQRTGYRLTQEQLHCLLEWAIKHTEEGNEINDGMRKTAENLRTVLAAHGIEFTPATVEDFTLPPPVASSEDRQIGA